MAFNAMREAEKEEQEAKFRLIEINRLSDVKTLSDLEKDADKLWPAYPEKISDMEKWLKRQEALADREQRLDKLRLSMADDTEMETDDVDN